MNKVLEIFDTIRSYQQEGVKFLIDRDSALLADEMGLGKTVQAAVASSSLVNANPRTKVLIVCPTSLCWNWEMEIKRWAPKMTVRRIRGDSDDRKAHLSLPFKAWIASYDQIRNDIDFLRKECKFDLVILDEAQIIKNPASSIALACRQLRREKAWVLTGTPIENKLDDLLSIFAFLKPGLLHAALNIDQIHDRMAPYFLRRNKKEVLSEVPEIISQDLYLSLESKQQEAYEDELLDTRSSIHDMQGKISTVGLLAQITKLKQLCNFDVISGESCKFKALETILDGVEEKKEKILVFSQYVNSIMKIKTRLNNVPVDCLHGDMSSEERQKSIDLFEKSSGPRVFLISLKAGGVGINLVSASRVILFDRWWNPAVEDQAIYRAHRYGRKEPLHVIKFLVMNTIEERIEQILSEKRYLFEGYVNNADTAEIGPFTKEDLIRIVGIDALRN
tara:strand:+ start:433 stop:1776 length:1344 start_codon:yes stop_codon:yes gene_type:complete